MRALAGSTIAMVLACSCRGDVAAPRTRDDWRVEPSAPVRVALTGLTFPLEPPSPTPLVAVPTFAAIELDRPLWLGHAGDGSGRIFVAEQGGRVLVFDGRRDVETAGVFLDLRERVRTEHDEEGLLAIAFAPDYARSGVFYAYYSASRPRRVVVSRFTVSSDPDHADPSSERVLLEVEQPYGNHNGGTLLFGPDGHLYLGLGDGGAAGDPLGAGQDLSRLLGKILRVRIADDGSLAIPRDNPFVGTSGARGEIWAYGLRNPWRCSFDRLLGTLWCGDVGQDRLEEIDVIVRGGNYGWNRREGSRAYEGAAPPGAIDPIHDYGRHDGQSITGGYVYRGTHVPSLRGAYVYGDYGSGNVWALDHDGTRMVGNRLVARVPRLTSFGEDQAGELYAVSRNGRIYRFEPARTDDAAPAFPTLLSQTGLFVDTARLEPDPGLLPYDVEVELWSDGARKRRWLALPDGATIDFAIDGPWRFPVGTATVKHFELELASGEVRRLETRVMVHERRGWAGYTYRWNDAQTDAELVTSPQESTHRVATPAGEVELRWYYPAGNDCLRCHTSTYGEVLGIRTRQLAPRTAASGMPLVADWRTRGLFTHAPDDLDALPRHAALADAAAPIEARVRAYLDVNCAICHHAGGPAPSAMDLRTEVALADAKLIDAVPDAPIGLPDERRVAARAPGSSAVLARMATRERGAMPPLASSRVDEAAVALVRTWIDGL